MSRGTLRTVLLKDQKIYKHFTKVKWPGDLRKQWRLEAKALIYLQERGIECPQFVSLHEEGREAVAAAAHAELADLTHPLAQQLHNN